MSIRTYFEGCSNYLKKQVEEKYLEIDVDLIEIQYTIDSGYVKSLGTREISSTQVKIRAIRSIKYVAITVAVQTIYLSWPKNST